ncbi:MAG TPA: BON domain-containing protein [Polyangia bacterium]
MSSWSAVVAIGAMGLTVGLIGALAGAAHAQGYGTPPAPTVQPNVQPAVTDSSITAEIHAKMDQSKLLHRAQVTIATQDGVVTLTGTVPNDFARDQALEAVRSTPGVLRLNDQLRLDISSPQAPARN